MSTILEKILAVKREEVAAAKLARSFMDVDADAKTAGPTRGLANALRRPRGEPQLAPEIGDKPFMVMELLSGAHLGEHLARRGPLSVGELCTILRQAADALDKVHAVGIVHRDLKFENLFFY